MRVAIAQVDGKWPNLALAKLAAHHIVQGDEVEQFVPLMSGTYDRVYASKIFSFTDDDPYLPDTAILGGTGYDKSLTLDGGVEDLMPDWGLWPWWTADMGFTTRGCVRKCGFCWVPEKEGRLRVVAEFGDLWTGRREMVLLDNNATAAPIEHFRKFCSDATDAGVKVSFCQGLDARLFTPDHAAALAGARLSTQIYFAFDNMRDEEAVRRTIRTCADAGIRPGRLMFYVLTGFDTTPEEDLYRVELLRSLGSDPFVMPYHKRTRYQMDFARWVNRKELFKSCTFDEYRKSVGRAA